HGFVGPTVLHLGPIGVTCLLAQADRSLQQSRTRHGDAQQAARRGAARALQRQASGAGGGHRRRRGDPGARFKARGEGDASPNRNRTSSCRRRASGSPAPASGGGAEDSTEPFRLRVGEVESVCRGSTAPPLWQKRAPGPKKRQRSSL